MFLADMEATPTLPLFLNVRVQLQRARQPSIQQAALELVHPVLGPLQASMRA